MRALFLHLFCRTCRSLPPLLRLKRYPTSSRRPQRASRGYSSKVIVKVVEYTPKSESTR